MNGMSLQEFKPTIFFLVKFVGIYLVANLLYGFIVSSYEPHPDPATSIVATQTSAVLNVCGWSTSSIQNAKKPTADIYNETKAILAVYEGCNGINVMIIFVAFVVGFGPFSRTMLWFIPAGLVAIHLVNLFRVSVLFWVSIYQPDKMYFLHKYFFTAVLYVVVFVLWVIWVRKYSSLRKAVTS